MLLETQWPIENVFFYEVSQREEGKGFRITASLLKTSVFSEFAVFEFEYRSFLSFFTSLSLSVDNTQRQ